MTHTIQIHLHNGNTTQITFNSRNELKEDEYKQKMLKIYNSHNDKNFQRIKCCCNKDVNTYLSSKKSPTSNKYFISIFPNTGKYHEENCIFYSSSENLIDDDGNYSSKVLDEPEYIQKATQKQIDEQKDKERGRQKTFYNLCRDIISRSYSMAFYKKNEEAALREDIKNPDYKNFKNTFIATIKAKDIFMKGSIEDSLPDPEKFSFVYGIISEDIFSKLNDEKAFTFKIKVDSFKFPFYVTRNRLELASRLVNNYGTAIPGPYFFIGVNKKSQYTDKDGKQKNKSTLIRFFVIPIANLDNQICFVDSKKERLYAEKLITEGKSFLKPTAGEYYKLPPRFTQYNDAETSELKKKVNLHYLPDFVEFDKDHIYITEVHGGYKERSYQLEFERKEKHYRSLTQKSNKLYLFKSVK